MHARALSFLLFLLFTVSSHGQVSGSQSFVLEWEQAQLRSDRYGIDVRVPVVRNQGFDDRALPVYSSSFNVQNKGIVLDYQIINVKFSSISSQELAGIQKEDIPSSLEPRFSLSSVRGKFLGTVEINPLIRQEGQVKKVNSFTVNYTLGADTDPRTLNRSTARALKDNSVLRAGNWYKFRIPKFSQSTHH